MKIHLKMLIILGLCVSFVGCSTGLNGLSYSTGDSVIEGGDGGDTEEVGVEGSIVTKTLSGSVVKPQVDGDQRLASLSSKALANFANSACSNCEVQIRNYVTSELIETVYTESDGSYSVEVEEDLIKDPNDSSKIKLEIEAKITDGLGFNKYFEESLGGAESYEIGSNSIDDHFGYIFAEKSVAENQRCQNRFTKQMFAKADRDAEIEISEDQGPAVVVGSLSLKESYVDERMAGSIYDDILDTNMSDCIGILMSWFECLIANNISATLFGYEDYNELIDSLTRSDFNVKDLSLDTLIVNSGECLPDNEDQATANSIIILSMARYVLDEATDIANSNVVNDTNMCGEDQEIEQMVAMMVGFESGSYQGLFEEYIMPELKTIVEIQRDHGNYITDVDEAEIIPAYLENSRSPLTDLKDRELEVFVKLANGGGDYYGGYSKSDKLRYAKGLVALSQAECFIDDSEKMFELDSSPDLYSQAYLNDLDCFNGAAATVDDIVETFCASKTDVVKACKDDLLAYQETEGSLIGVGGSNVFATLDICSNEIPESMVLNVEATCGDNVCNILSGENEKSCSDDCTLSGSGCVAELNNKLVGAIEISEEIYGDEDSENGAVINCIGDIEYYKILVDSGETLSVLVTVNDDDPEYSLDRTKVVLVNSDHEILASNGGYDGSYSACVSITNSSGQDAVPYYAIVHGLSDKYTGTYTITATTSETCDDMFGDDVIQ